MGGGKSRKSGGVSRKLIQALKAGKYDKKTNNGENKAKPKSLFGTSSKDED